MYYVYFLSFLVFHLQLQWIDLDSWLMEAFTTDLFRRCSSLKVRIVQTSEFMVTSNLQLHPFRAMVVTTPYCTKFNILYRFIKYHKFLVSLCQPYIQISSTQENIRIFGYPSAVNIVERLFFSDRKRDDWIADDNQRTQWGPLGLPVPTYHHGELDSTKGPLLRPKHFVGFKDKQFLHR